MKVTSSEIPLPEKLVSYMFHLVEAYISTAQTSLRSLTEALHRWDKSISFTEV